MAKNKKSKVGNWLIDEIKSVIQNKSDKTAEKMNL